MEDSKETEQRGESEEDRKGPNSTFIPMLIIRILYYESFLTYPFLNETASL